MNQYVTKTLHNLGVTRNYTGYQQFYIAIELVLEDENRLLTIGKDLYTPIAKRFNCNTPTIERNIRTIINHVWRTNREFLFKIAGFPMYMQPTVSQFIDIVSNYINCTYYLVNDET